MGSMRLESVEIVGFKSFCDKQELSFKGGVTGIVGPNGCGKSNISDAISWVLGEQSVKSLRGSSMEDVIFAGSQSRQPLAMAEVNLKVSGLNGNSPDGSPDCVVTRRLYRNGESEYLMNGQVCRLRDVHELFMDTGLGSKAYSIIEQGKIGLILSSKPADRRALIEEAAGITKYKARRRQTQLKLEAAQQNLLRVNDIVHEVEKQLESLKRQASKARRYRAVREEMQAVERVLFGRRFLDLMEQTRTLGERFDAESERERAATVALETEEARMEVRRQALYEEEARLEEVRGRLNDLTLAVDRYQGKSGYAKDQIAETATRAEQAAREADELQSRVGPLEDMLATRRRDEEQLRAERAAADLLKLAAEREELEREWVRVGAGRGGAQVRGQEAETLLARLGQEREEATLRAASARVRAESLEGEADGFQSERDSLAGRLASLHEIVETHAAFDEGVRALLARPEGLEVTGVVADVIETDSACERAVEAFLGDRLQAVLVPDASHAVRGVRWLQESGAGRGTFLPLANAHDAADGGPFRDIARQEPKVRGLLSALYRVTGPHADRIRASLPDALVVETLEDALEVVGRRGPVACVTLAGETLRGAMVEGGRSVKGLLAPRREIREASVRREEVESRLLVARAGATEQKALVEAATAEARALEERIHVAEKELVAIRHELQTADEESVRLDRKASILDSERRQAEREKGTAAVKLSEIEQALLTAEAEREAGSRSLASLPTAVAEARATAEAAQSRSSEARARLAALRERQAAAENECRRLGQDLSELAERIEAARARGQEMAARGGGLQAELEECERLLAEALRDRDRVCGEAAVAEDRVREIRNELEGREQSLKERRREREMLKDALSELEVQKARTGSDLDHLARECHQAVGQTAAEAAAGLNEEDLARETAGLETQVAELRERLERMGQVNVLAVEQAQELEDRHAFLTAQRQDLLESIAELDQAIKKIDKASRERFQEAFQIINQHFGEVFKQLFGGGTAGLTLIDEEDLLESGIDVMAHPPGKRLQNVMLLSGGDKT